MENPYEMRDRFRQGPVGGTATDLRENLKFGGRGHDKFRERESDLSLETRGIR